MVRSWPTTPEAVLPTEPRRGNEVNEIRAADASKSVDRLPQRYDERSRHSGELRLEGEQLESIPQRPVGVIDFTRLHRIGYNSFSCLTIARHHQPSLNGSSESVLERVASMCFAPGSGIGCSIATRSPPA